MHDADLFDFAAIDSFRPEITPAQIARREREEAKGRAAADAYQGALNNGATADEAKSAARKAAAIFTAAA
jgi:hypothetical protein